MSLDDVDLQVLLLDRLAAAKAEERARRDGETVDEAITAAMEG